MSSDLSSPAKAGYAVTPSDATVLSPLSRALYIGGAGDVSVLLNEDTVPITFVGVAAGQILPVRAKKIMATGTTATNILALY